MKKEWPDHKTRQTCNETTIHVLTGSAITIGSATTIVAHVVRVVELLSFGNVPLGREVEPLSLFAVVINVMIMTVAMRIHVVDGYHKICLLYTSPSPRDLSTSRMPSSA